MSKQQLYINGKAVDMPTDEIKIKVESNIFSDADKIKTAHSYNIALPRTMTNDSIFALAYVPSAETGGRTTHTYLKASLYMDGVPLFVDGQAVLTSVDEKGYNINLYWGLLGVFDEIKREGLDLCDMPASIHWNEATMSPPSHWVHLEKYDDGVPEYDSGMTQNIYDNELSTEGKEEADKLPWIMPSIRASVILNKIAQVYGLSLYKTLEASERIYRIWHPLVSLNIMAKGEKLSVELDAGYELATGAKKYIDLSNAVPVSSNSNICASGFAILNNTPNFGRTFLASNRAHATSIRVYGTCDKEFKAIIGGSITRNSVYNSDSGLWEMDETIYNIDSHEFLSIEPPSYYNESYGWDRNETPQINVHATLIFDEISEIKNMGPSGVAPPYLITWNYERNYPAIGIIDYIGEILAHIGGCVVGSVTKPNNLIIATLDEIYNAEPINLDEYEVISITMTLDDVAQKNIYEHKEYNDDNSDWTAEGVIYTNDETLELERKAFTSKFKVPKGGLIRLWEVSADTDSNGKHSAKWVANGDYIAGYLSEANVLMNTGQDFASTIADYYTNYEQIINHPKEIEVVVRLSVLDLLNFDMARPVYIKQLGRKYLIKSLESDSGEKYKLTLVQI